MNETHPASRVTTSGGNRVGVVADDTTGALDMGSVFFRTGRTVRVWLHPVKTPLHAEVDVTIIDTDSRLDAPEVARGKVAAATRTLQAAGCTRFHKKTCSVFRGNIGAEFDAMLDLLGVPAAIISLAYPALGRTTIQGHHFVHGVPLHETAFARDPVHPSTTSELAAVLARQSRRHTAVVSLELVRRGAGELRAALAQASRAHEWVLVDGETEADLRILAEAVAGYPLLGGAAGLAAVWPHPAPPPREQPPRTLSTPRPGSPGVLIVCGSLTPQSQAQVACLRETGIACAELSAATAGEGSARDPWIAATAHAAAATLRAGRDFLIHSEFATPTGPGRFSSARSVSLSLALVVQRTLAAAPASALVVAGGDTSGGICRTLGINAIDVVDELAPGVPLGFAHGAVSLPVVLKSGSFGAPDFLGLAARISRTLSSTPNPAPVPCSTA